MVRDGKPTERRKMKSLNEVIKKFELCNSYSYDMCNGNCPYFDDKCACDPDALYYLREYQEMKEHLACLNDGEIRGDNTQIVNNLPLTWDELKDMEGKPIWVEYEGFAPDWEIIIYIGNTKWKWGEVIETHLSILHKENQGKTWKAYRKERKNETD